MHIVLAYKNFAANKNISHIGLGVAAINTAKVLTRAHIKTSVWPIVSAADLAIQLKKTRIDHVIISAPWISAQELYGLSTEFHDTQFTVCCHSNVGFLQADRNGVKLLRDTMDVQQSTMNVHLAGNTIRFSEFIEHAFGAKCAFLPNLYYLDDAPQAPYRPFVAGTLKIGAFGAVRPLKNLMSSAAAALEIARKLQVPLELWISEGRAEGGGEVSLNSVKEMVAGLPGVSLKFNGWQTWPEFRRTVGSMDLLLQPSYTESFNMVTADGVAEGVPSVVSPAIDWAPESWQADPDDTLEISRIGRRLLLDPLAAVEGLDHLKKYVRRGIGHYEVFLRKHQYGGGDLDF